MKRSVKCVLRSRMYSHGAQGVFRAQNMVYRRYQNTDRNNSLHVDASTPAAHQVLREDGGVEPSEML